MITGKMLKARGWPQGRVIGIVKSVAEKLEESNVDRVTILTRLDEVRANAADWKDDAMFGALATEVLRRETVQFSREADQLRETPLEFATWGAEHIEEGAMEQMRNAMRLPVTAAGALMPDAHLGYGLPIGGVLATRDVVIPYAVGVDIACRMRLSIYPESPEVLVHKSTFEKALQLQTVFGAGGNWQQHERPAHDVLDDDDWKSTSLLRSLKDKAAAQLGTSGSGNHFVEWGEFHLPHDDAQLGLKAGVYLALLSHSGSRGVGFKIANEYSKLARQLHPMLPPSVAHLAWLSMSSEAGQSYWQAMELAGRFAKANHEVIHRRVADAAGVKELIAVENHHNFAWREKLADGSEVIVHRKGATPAGEGVLGIIPGSMGDAGYLVRGTGKAESINSASHGAGRRMSRRAATNSITRIKRDRYLQERGVKLLGGGLDESPQAYKDIESVINAQADLINSIGKFSPRIVKMADEAGKF